MLHRLERGTIPSIKSILFETSVSQLTAGRGIGVGAAIRNLSDEPIYLYQKTTTLALPPELTTHDNRGGVWWAFFPTECGAWDYNKTIDIKPGATYRVTFYVEPSPTAYRTSFRTKGKVEPPTEVVCGKTVNNEQQSDLPPRSLLSAFNETLDQMWEELQLILFSPGDYKVTVGLKGWTNPDQKEPSFTATESVSVNVIAPQTVVLLGAGIGGLVAFAILPKTRRKGAESAAPPTRKSNSSIALEWIVFGFSRIGHALIATLLSAIVAITLSRISQTQFPIRVSITDVWGAIAIGFAANYIGIQSLNRLFGRDQKEDGGAARANGRREGAKDELAGGQKGTKGP